jgi:hypothetical protein
MNCTVAQDAILAQPNPAELRGEPAAHVAGCATCRRWHREVVRLETALRRLPTPVSDGLAKSKTIDAILKNPIVPGKPGKSAVEPRRKSVPVRSRIAEWWPVGIAAAVVLTGSLIYLGMTRNRGLDSLAARPSDPFLERVVLAKVEVDAAQTAAERLKALADLSDVLCEQAKSLNKVSPGADMEAVAEMFNAVVADAMLAQARWLNAEEQRLLLGGFTERLAKTEQEANNLLSEAPAGSVGPLREMAKVARTGQETLAEIRRKAS